MGLYGMPELRGIRRRLALCRLIIRVRTGGVVGRINHAAKLGKFFREHRLNTVPERHINHAAALAAATETDIDDILLNIEQLDMPAMRG